MADEVKPGDGAATGLNEAQRAAAFATALSPEQRSAALRASRAPIPPRFIAWVIVAFVVLGVGGVLVEHYFGNVGVPATTTTAFTLAPTPSAPTGPQLSSTLSAFIGLKEIANTSAPQFTLRDQSNRSWSLRAARDKVVVLTFYNTNCNDVCPVLGAEIKQARSLLGTAASKVVFVIVNTDPHHFALNPTPPALGVPQLLDTPSVRFLTGPLPQLNAVWISYGVTVKVGIKASQIAHNNVMYFIGRRGQLDALATPFGNESHAGVFSLDAPDIHRFARGIAATAGSLIK
jgi:cytochrome oxidase Cu insertion factor (SCO1/SenC/PrrC family)